MTSLILLSAMLTAG
ncbi:MAG: hypothetical protein QG656_88, partial [Candidatus Hydrogenedentes bacterium]|nr:hypothetical protein [Candidatus Hydrogenedentota bacterium]